MSELTTAFKPHYFAGETATVTVTDADASSVSAVYGNSSLNLTGASGVWTGAINTSALVGAVNWTIFVTTSNVTTALAHGTFNVCCAGRSSLRDVVAKIDEAVETWGTNPNKTISVGEINISYKDLDELLAVRSQYVQRAEEQECGRATSGGVRTLEVRF